MGTTNPIRRRTKGILPPGPLSESTESRRVLTAERRAEVRRPTPPTCNGWFRPLTPATNFGHQAHTPTAATDRPHRERPPSSATEFDHQLRRPSSACGLGHRQRPPDPTPAAPPDSATVSATEFGHQRRPRIPPSSSAADCGDRHGHRTRHRFPIEFATTSAAGSAAALAHQVAPLSSATDLHHGFRSRAQSPNPAVRPQASAIAESRYRAWPPVSATNSCPGFGHQLRHGSNTNLGDRTRPSASTTGRVHRTRPPSSATDSTHRLRRPGRVTHIRDRSRATGSPPTCAADLGHRFSLRYPPPTSATGLGHRARTNGVRDRARRPSSGVGFRAGLDQRASPAGLAPPPPTSPAGPRHRVQPPTSSNRAHRTGSPTGLPSSATNSLAGPGHRVQAPTSPNRTHRTHSLPAHRIGHHLPRPDSTTKFSTSFPNRTHRTSPQPGSTTGVRPPSAASDFGSPPSGPGSAARFGDRLGDRAWPSAPATR